jgi:Carboxypeptidase regulatory-like domain
MSRHKLLGNIVVEPREVMPGQSVLVEVFDPKGKSYQKRKDVQVLIDGIHGAKQYLQFENEGNHVVQVVAIHKRDENVFKETKQIKVKVKAAPLAKKRGKASRSALEPSANTDTIGALRLASVPNRPYLTRFSILGAQTNLSSAAMKSSPKRGSESQTYTWKLGSSMTVKTNEPYLDYDFELLLDAQPDDLFQNVHVEVTTKAAGKMKHATRTLTVYNAYAMCKRRGYLSPRVFNPRLAARRADGYEVILGIENIESEPLHLTQQRVQALGVRTKSVVTELKAPMVIPAKTAIAVSFTVPQEAVSKGATGFVLFLGGDATLGKGKKKQTLPVRIESYFDLPVNDDVPLQKVSVRGSSLPSSELAATTTVLGPAGSLLAETLPSAQLRKQARTLLTKKSKIGKSKTGKAKTPHQVARTLPFLAEWRPDVKSRSAAKLAATARSALQAREGELCDPSSEGVSGNLVCQLRIGERPYEIEVPAHYENASKGDVLLSLGGDGVIARLLRQVTPAQYYDHSGMITRDMTSVVVDNRPHYQAQQITHATATTERLENFIQISPTVHIKEEALKYMWPGVITQNIHESIFGEPIQDIDTGKTYTISSFSPTTRMFVDQGVWKIIPPMLVKPDPMTETPAIRRLLHEVADEARLQKSHYRLFCYTDATINKLALTSAGWANGTFPSVCSSFIRAMLNRKGIHLEGELEDSDLQIGAKKGKADGLYLYDESERLTAAKDLHAYIMAQIRKLASGLISGLPQSVIDGVARQIANQIVNAFVSDDASPQSASSEAWKQPGTGDAVSPADILFWDSLPQGLYGYSTPARFRPTYIKVMPVHRWTKFQGTGSVSGTVSHKGNAVTGATVKLFKDKVAVTDARGKFTLMSVPVGSYELEAVKENQATGKVLKAVQLIDVITSETVSVELQSQGRMLSVQETARLRKGSSTPVKQSLSYDLNVSPLQPHDEFVAGVEWKEQGIKLEVVLKADWQENLTIRLDISYKVFMGSEESPVVEEQLMATALPDQPLTVTWQRRVSTDVELQTTLVVKNSESL